MGSLSDVSLLRPVRFFTEGHMHGKRVCGIVDKSMYILCLKVKRPVLYPDDGLAAHAI